MYDTWITQCSNEFSISGTFDCHTQEKLSMVVEMLKDMKFIVTEYYDNSLRNEMKLWLSWSIDGEQSTEFATKNLHFQKLQVPSMDTIRKLFEVVDLYNVYVTINVNTGRYENRFLEKLFYLGDGESSEEYYIRIYEGLVAILEYKTEKRNAYLIKPENKGKLLDFVARYFYKHFYFERVSNV